MRILDNFNLSLILQFSFALLTIFLVDSLTRMLFSFPFFLFLILFRIQSLEQ